MKDTLIEQYKHIRLVIGNNVDTIKNLFEQSKQLTTLVEQLSNSEANEELKNQLSDLNTKILFSIKNLISQTDQLFDKYDEFAKSIFE